MGSSPSSDDQRSDFRRGRGPGRTGDLLRAMANDPALLIWLDSDVMTMRIRTYLAHVGPTRR